MLCIILLQSQIQFKMKACTSSISEVNFASFSLSIGYYIYFTFMLCEALIVESSINSYNRNDLIRITKNSPSNISILILPLAIGMDPIAIKCKMYFESI